MQLWLSELSNSAFIPKNHCEYLQSLHLAGCNPRVIWDVGASVLHWYKLASSIWPQAQIYCFDANASCEFLYKQAGVKYHLGIVSNSDRRTVRFWQNAMHPGGSSYYRENPELSQNSDQLYTVEQSVLLPCRTLKTIARQKNWPSPNLLKMDVQGAELDVLQGMGSLLSEVEDIILELQQVDYNLGAPKSQQVIEWLNQNNFTLISPKFCDNGHDADYHFRRKDLCA